MQNIYVTGVLNTDRTLYVLSTDDNRREGIFLFFISYLRKVQVFNKRPKKVIVSN